MAVDKCLRAVDNRVCDGSSGEIGAAAPILFSFSSPFFFFSHPFIYIYISLFFGFS